MDVCFCFTCLAPRKGGKVWWSKLNLVGLYKNYWNRNLESWASILAQPFILQSTSTQKSEVLNYPWREINFNLSRIYLKKCIFRIQIFEETLNQFNYFNNYVLIWWNINKKASSVNLIKQSNLCDEELLQQILHVK